MAYGGVGLEQRRPGRKARGAPRAPRLLIVNADDFGLNSSANHAIIRAHRDGILTSASLMLNEPGFEEAVALAREHPLLGIGLHLTLLCGHSTLGPDKIPGLVNEKREFDSDPVRVGFQYFFRRRALREQLRAEIRAQFEKFCAIGFPLDHVDSHHHLHAHPVVFRILIESAEQLGITHLRLTSEPFGVHARLAIGYRLERLSHGIIYWLLAGRARRALRRLDIKHTDAVFGLLQDARVDESYLERLLPRLPPGVSEIYSHPSLDRFKHEMEALISPRIRALVEELGIRLIRYRDI
ncbi:MAG: hopanoid biosynthesis-associated protein HpnK [Verrucomicrobia subdivision 3 bacterium]|nr:hopanoid biosynthesis-associated protein HpnK [Limisphaerales bacterium]